MERTTLGDQQIAYILGAGASVHAGYPLVSNFMTTLSKCQPVDSPELEELFLKISNIVKQFPRLNIEELIRIADSPSAPEYQEVKNMVITGEDDEDIGRQYVIAPIKIGVIYLLNSIAQKTPGTSEMQRFIQKSDGTIITFNWDILADSTLKESHGIDWMTDKLKHYCVPIYLKLHGSADCAYCLNCKELIRLDNSQLMSYLHMSDLKCPYCGSIEGSGNEMSLYSVEPLIIGFSNDKREELAKIPLLQTQWNMARRQLIQCSEMVIIGFSFNQIDRHIRFFLDGILRMREKDLIIRIINPDTSDEFKINVLEAFGNVADDNRVKERMRFDKNGTLVNFEFERMNFAQYVSAM
jgi:NAD-dependent SIR2 family protein deacetylase